ncbi:MAG TPA: NAD-dependent epimerase/dehydratase family protein, partial [Sneathiellales bacterium]|nr:NAD-dependent epimerase/dehydratase family protein [Sneathiellales bacterium]
MLVASSKRAFNSTSAVTDFPFSDASINDLIIGDSSLVRELLHQHRPEAIVNFAAESHVDRSIDSPLTFVETNVLGT